MIFYFTGTGNSFAAAHTIAEITHDELVDIGESYRMGRFGFRVEQGETLGFVFPVYDRAVPRIVSAFIDWLAFITPNGNPFVPGYCFCAITCGESVGTAAKAFAKELKAALNIRLDASYSIEDVDNCIIKHSPGSPEERRMRNHAAHRQAPAAEDVDEPQHVAVIGDAQVAPDLVLLDVSGVDGDDDLRLVLQLLQHADLAVWLESGQHPGGVVVVKQLAAELQIQLSAELRDAVPDVLRLHLQVLLVVKADFCQGDLPL